MGEKMLKVKHVTELTGLSRTTIWRACRSGKFPLPLELSPNLIAWPASEIDEWLERCPRRNYPSIVHDGKLRKVSG